jgi:hypothetical protein
VKSGKGLNRWKEFTWLKYNAEENLLEEFFCRFSLSISVMQCMKTSKSKLMTFDQSNIMLRMLSQLWKYMSGQYKACAL